MDNNKPIASLKNKFKGKRCFIVATGPSLAYKDLSFLKNEITIALNLAPLVLDKFGIKPIFHIIADKYQYPRFKDVFEKLTYNTLVKKVIVASACDTFPNNLIDKNTFFFPKKLLQVTPHFSQNPIKKGFARGKTVAYDAIQLAFFLGFDEVYIIGMDLGLKYEWGENGHCYEIHQNNTFINLNFCKTKDIEIQRGLPGHPEYFNFISECMKLAREMFQKFGKKIYNDNRSKLNILEKRDILNEFGACKKVVAFVPAKGNSSRIKKKNLKQLGNKPLFLHILDTLLNCHTVDEVYLDSESEEIFSSAKGRGHIELKRDINLASNDIDGNQLLLNEATQIIADIYIQALPTSPFISSKTVDEAVFQLLISNNNDSVFSISKQKLYLWSLEGKPINYNPLKIPNSIDLVDTIIETTGLYIINRESIFKRRSRIGENPILFEIPLIETIDINNPEDFYFAETITRGLKE